MRAAKQNVRREVLQLLKDAAASDPAQERSARLRARLAPILESTEPLCVAIYAPLPHEVNLMPLLGRYPQHRFVFPRCLSEHQLEFRQVIVPETDLEPGAMGILAPAVHTPTIRPQEIDILIIPGVAFTRQGDRLGYGGGYYDRFIHQCPQARILALAFPEQMRETLPTEAHDFRIPEIITSVT